MARESKTEKKERGTKKQAVNLEYTVAVADDILLDFYSFKGEKKSETKYTVKITLCNAFVIFCRIIVMDDYAFIAYPSYKNKKGDYKNLAYCFDKDICEQINEEVNAFIFD